MNDVINNTGAFLLGVFTLGLPFVCFGLMNLIYLLRGQGVGRTKMSGWYRFMNWYHWGYKKKPSLIGKLVLAFQAAFFFCIALLIGYFVAHNSK